MPIGEVSLFSFNTALKNPPLCPTQRHGSGTTDGALPSSGLTGRFITSAANRLIAEVGQSRRRPLLGPSPG